MMLMMNVLNLRTLGSIYGSTGQSVIPIQGSRDGIDMSINND